MKGQPVDSGSLVCSYLSLRKAVGIIGAALPFALAFGRALLEGPELQSSLSSSYYSGMRDLFVGSLCAIAVFLMPYRGYERIDDIAGDVACVFGVGRALFPAAPDLNATAGQKLIGALHFTFAALFFLTVAYFALVLFRKTDPSKTPTHRKLQRNAVYAVCGCTMLACLALIAVLAALPDGAPIKRIHPVFWLESLAIVAFGVSWLTKGEAILKDQEGVT
ncbi:MAG: DUF998 domain-containing protein [Candidatus Solibacter usitatus]|nr:DUF998 domain-containing protein [Candidatus Solibacter usitatus]